MGNIFPGIELGEYSSYVLAMRVDACLQLWETAHGSLRGNLEWLHEFRTRPETERIVRFPDDDIERCVLQEVRLVKILALLEATNERPPEYPDLPVQNPPDLNDWGDDDDKFGFWSFGFPRGSDSALTGDEDDFPHLILDGWADQDPDEIQEHWEFSGEDI